MQNKFKNKILITLGPSTLNAQFLRKAEKLKVALLRLNMSHLSVMKLKKNINFIKKYTNSDAYHVPYGTEAGIIQSYGLSTIIFGPGSIKQAHKPDEYIKLSELDKFDKILSKIN